ncbi:hypothetical protein R1flu_001425 [Riccia fluitans]|uniref:Uncharacterized protein n=1 Tax=Riccia fluitans TaxID=41844 RepID=A0ABD1Y3C1_9MARC
MDNEGRNEHCKSLETNLQRILGVIKSMPPSQEFSVILAQVVSLIRGFKILGRSYADQLVLGVQEVNTLKTKKQLLEKKLQLLRYQAYSVFPEKTVVSQDASELNVFKPRPAIPEQNLSIGYSRKDENLEVNLHRKMASEEISMQRERELAKLGEVYTKLSSDLVECRKETSRLESRFREIKIQEMKRANERRELFEIRTQEIRALKEVIISMEAEITRLGKKAGGREEQLLVAISKSENIPKSDPQPKDVLRREHMRLRMYLRDLSSRLLNIKGSDDLQVELWGLECKGFDAETSSYLRTILETGLKAWEEHDREKLSESTGGSQLFVETVNLDMDDKHL